MRPLALLSASCASLTLLGCDALFDVERRELGPFRIAAIGVVDGEASAAIWSGDGLYHDEAPTLEWTLDGRRLGEGWGLPVTDGDVLELTATSANGDVKYATVSVRDTPRAFEINRYAAVLTDVSLEARREADVRPIDGAADPGESVRVRLGADEGSVARWMTALGEGTALELEDLAADLFDETLLFEDGELASREPLDRAFTHHLALVIDGDGGNRWSWIDAAYETEESMIRHEGWLIPVERNAAPGAGETRIAVTLVEDDGVTGIRFEDIVGVDDLTEQTPLTCAIPDEPFRLSWIAEGRCPRPDVVGARVVLEVW